MPPSIEGAAGGGGGGAAGGGAPPPAEGREAPPTPFEEYLAR